MKSLRRFATTLVLCTILTGLPPLAMAQNSVMVLADAELLKVVPPGFYFQGQSAPTQMRNSAAARFGADRNLIAGMVDTSGYSAEVRARYEGFLITDSPVVINGTDLGTGAYGFGFNSEGKLNILDLAGKEVISVSTTKDQELKRPRPLMMQKVGNEVRLYRGKDYVTIVFK